MENPFYAFLASLEGMSFQTPSAAELEQLEKLTGGRMPEMFRAVYEIAEPAADTEYDGFVFYGLGRMADENTEYVPGANLLPLGLFTFASLDDGDSISFDMNVPGFPVYLCSHETMNGECDIEYFEDGNLLTAPFNYENVVRYAQKLADSFAGFVTALAAGEL